MADGLPWPTALGAGDRDIDAVAGATPGAEPGTATVTLASGRKVDLRATVPTDGVIRLRLGADLPAADPTSPMLVAIDAAPATVRAVDGGVALDAPGVTASLTSAGIAFATARPPSPTVLPGRPLATGIVRDAGADAGWALAVGLDPDAGVFGGGESFQGPDLRGRIRELVNREAHGVSGVDVSYLNVPFFWSDAGWGLFLHTGAPARADIGSTHTEVGVFTVEDEALDVFLVAGDTPATIIRRYLAVTGLPGRFPAWGLGVWSSRCSYLSADELGEIVRGYRGADCPVDVVHVDAWVTGNVVADLTCNWTIDRDRFPAGWARELAAEGVRVSLWHNPYLLAGTPVAAEAEAAGLLCVDADGVATRTADKGDRVVLDLTNPAAVAWWEDKVASTARAEGITAFKPDFGEELPLDSLLHDGRTGRQARNEYGLVYQAGTHRALSGALGTDELALFCRSGTAGAQRYPCHWVGDTPSSWSGLVTALRACLSLSLSGFAFVSHDVGGFWTMQSHVFVAEAFEKMDGSNVPADVDPELFARWTQWGALSPVLRFHGTGRREPWAYPDPWGTIAVEACRLRERLRPYLERIAAEASTTGMPLMRPMVLSHPDERAGRAAELQYLLGPDVLVAPLLDAGGTRRLWVPPGRWEPLLAPHAVEGPGWTTVTCEPHQFPAWKREGADL